MSYLIDTNLLVRLAVPEDPRNPTSRHAVDTLGEVGLFACSRRYEVLGIRAVDPGKI